MLIELVGGPPWGFRISEDEKSRPIIAQLLSGGYGEASGLRIGDLIRKIGNLEVHSCQQAYSLAHAFEGKLKLEIDRNPEGYHPTVRREKLSNSVQTSPIFQRSSTTTFPTSSVPNSPILSRASFLKNNTSPSSSPRQVRMDMMHGSRRIIDNKREIFEKLAKTNPTSNPIVKLKAQSDDRQETPATSSTGYDSVAADFAGERSLGTSPESTRSSPEELTVVENFEDKMNVYNNGNYANNNSYVPDLTNSKSAYYAVVGDVNQNHPAQPSASTSSHQWNIRTEQPQNNMPADGDIEVPVRRNVAALRQVINDRLEMKTPVGGVSATRPKTPQDPETSKPSWAANVKVYEPNGFIDPHANKHNMGRVLEGPISPNKYFQGVPPPSYHQVPTEAKPPAPPAKPVVQQNRTSSTIRLPPEMSSNSYQGPPKLSYKVPYDQVLFQNLETGGDLDDGASMISSCISTFGDSSEVAAISAAGAQRQLYDQYKRGLFNSGPSSGSGLSPRPTTIPEENDSSLFSTDIQLTPFGQPNVQRENNRRSMDLESSQLLVKAKSPTPYSTQSADHYGTIRKRHTPVKLEPLESPSESVGVQMGSVPVTPPATIDSRSDSGYVGSNAISPENASSKLEKALSEAFEMASSIASSMNLPSGLDGSESVDSRRPESFMSTSTNSNIGASGGGCGGASSSSTHETTSPPLTPRPISSTSVSQAASQGFGTLPTALAEDAETDPQDQMYPKRHFHAQTEPEMSLWYRKMFKQMHKVEAEPSTDPINLGQIQQNQQKQQYIDQEAQKRLHLPEDNTGPPISRQPQKVDVDITPRRARSVGRVIEQPQQHSDSQQPVGNSSEYREEYGPTTARPSNLFALERSRTPHFHLPSYKFRDDDNRPIRCTFGGCEFQKKSTFGTPCQKCGIPRKDVSFAEIDGIYSEMEKRRTRDERRSQKKIELFQITDKLDKTTKELDVFIKQLEQTWTRSKSQPAIRITKPPLSPIKKDKTPTNLAAEIEHLKRISNEEAIARQKVEKLSEELQKEKERRHNYIPSAAPSLHRNMDRFEGLVNNYSRKEKSPMRGVGPEDDIYSQSGRPVIVTATVVYRFDAKSARELSLNKGDIVRIIREVDSHWLEGERNGRSGIFPASYVQIESEFERNRQKMRAIYPFTARNSNELSLKRGEIVTFRREIDMNWMEGSNQIGQIGIFPTCYVRMMSDPPPQETDVGSRTSLFIPDRPKTPKISGVTAGEFEQPGIVLEEGQETSYHQQPQAHPVQQNVNHRVRFEEPKIQEDFNFDQTNYEALNYGESQNSKREVDRLNEWESRKYAQPSTQPPQQIPTEKHPWVQQEQKPIYSKTTTQPNFEQPKQQPAIRNNPAAMIPKGSEMYRAAFNYKPQKHDELELIVNDIIFVVEKCDDGWFIGTSLRTGEFGIFPGNYVQRH